MPRVCRAVLDLRCNPGCAIASDGGALLPYVAHHALKRAAHWRGFRERANAVSAYVICEDKDLPGFDNLDALKAYYAKLPAVKVVRVGVCRCCSRWHAEAVMDRIERSGPIPPAAQATGNRLSARDTERFNAL